MERTELKNRVIQCCILRQKEHIQTLQRMMDEVQQMIEEAGPPKDRYDPYRPQLTRKYDMYALQLSKANEELRGIEQIKTAKLSDKVAFGTVIHTNLHKIIVAGGIGKINVDNVEYFSVSATVPVFNALKDHKKGESIVFNGKELKILDVF